MGLFLDSTGSAVYVLWDEGRTEPFQDITTAFGATARVIMRLTVGSITNKVSAELDFGADGIIDIARYAQDACAH